MGLCFIFRGKRTKGFVSELLIRQAKTTCKKQLNEVYAAAGKTRNLRTDGIQAEFNFFFFFFFYELDHFYLWLKPVKILVVCFPFMYSTVHISWLLICLPHLHCLDLLELIWIFATYIDFYLRNMIKAFLFPSSAM